MPQFHLRRLPIRPKLLLFYGGTIAAVLVLFRLTTAFGETRLQAPPNIDGIYLSSTSPPGCPSDFRLQLTLQQSGIYLNGSFEPVEASASSASHSATSERLPLTGRWQQGELTLSGRTPALSACQTAQNSAQNSRRPAPMHLIGTIAPAEQPANQLTATLQLDDSTSVWNFTADRQAVSQAEEH